MADAGRDIAKTASILALDAAGVARTPLVVAQLGQSLDGRIAAPSGHSHYVNGPAAISFLHMLRARVDAVIVGAGTVAADDPQLTVRRVNGPNPARVIIDPSRRAGGALRCLADDGVRRVVVGPKHPADPPGIEYLPVGPEGLLEPSNLIATLQRRGLPRLLVEGGSRTVSLFMAAGTIDRLCILIGPMILGSGPIGMNLPPIETVQEAIGVDAQWTLLDGGDLVADCRLTRKPSQ